MSRGFSETDAPDPEEIVRRVAIERAPIPPEMASVMLQSLNPEFFDQAAKAGAEEAGIPDDVRSLPRRPRRVSPAGAVGDGAIRGAA